VTFKNNVIEKRLKIFWIKITTKRGKNDEILSMHLPSIDLFYCICTTASVV
jgi:hypothetical protein